jgi:hypothetical protein
MAVAIPPVEYARSGDIHIAYQVVGSGPIDVVFVEGSLTNRYVCWEEPGLRRFYERL